MNIRLVAFTNLFPRPWEPQRATFNRQQLEWLSRYYDLEVVVPVSWLDWLKARWKGQDLVSVVSKVKAHYFVYCYIPKLFRWSYGATMLLSTLQILPKLIGRFRPQAIYATWAYPDGLAAVILGRLLNIPVVVKVQGDDINTLPGITGVRPQIAWMLQHANAIVAVSQDLAKKVRELGAAEENTHVIYNGVDPLCFKPFDQQECREQFRINLQSKVILFVGNLLRPKGCLDLFESFITLIPQIPDALLVYVGAGDECAAQMHARVAELGLQGSVRWVGIQSPEKVATWMGAADVVALPSYAEGVPNVLLEAMACGKPVVATQAGGIPEVIPSFAGTLVAPGDIPAIANALQNALAAKWDTSKILTHVSQFTWERNIQELKLILDGKAASAVMQFK